MPADHPPAGAESVPPLLTIGIPTYNRRPYVEKLLRSLESELAQLNREVAGSIEILVSNNDSRDDTALLLDAMKTRLPNLRVHTQPRNLGPYENIITCIEKARGEWVWVHGDDDVQIPAGLGAVIQLLHRTRADYVVLFGTHYARPFTGEFCGRLPEYVRFCVKTEPYLLLEHSLITSNIFRKKLFDPQDMRKWVETDYGHMYALMRGCLASDSLVCLSDLDVFHVPEDRPPFECWPKNIDSSWREYLGWLSDKTGVQIDVDRAMDYTRTRLKEELRHPLRFVRKNYQNVFRFGAYPFLAKRLFTLFFKKG